MTGRALSFFRCVGVLTIATSLLVACDGRERPRSIGDEVFTFTNLPDIVSASDAVVDGTVLKVEPGRVVGPPEDPVQVSQVTLQVNEVFYGAVEVGSRILLEEGFGIPPLRSQEGSTGIFFLHLKDENTEVSYYRLTNSQGRFIALSGKIEASNDEMPWVQVLEDLTPAQFEVEVKNAIDDAGPSPEPNVIEG